MIIRKSKREIEKMQAAGRIVADTLTRVIAMTTPGITLMELDAMAEDNIRSKGATPTFKGYRDFPATLCTSVNEEVVHGIPSDRVLKDGDVVSVDCGATLDGYIGDSAVTIPVGNVSDEIKKLLEVTEASLFAGIAAAVPGNRLFDVSYAIQRHVEPTGYGIVRDYCGHGVGRQLHEEPQVPNFGRPGTGPRIKAGWCLALEPMVNLGTHEVITLDDGWTVVTKDRLVSAHFEHSIAITADGPIVLTDRRGL
ncbi:MAG: methionyl aminopeptidase [Myxococcota bacterium]|jgi:methionyl aminopeptidase